MMIERAPRHCMVVHAYYPIGETRVQREAQALAQAGWEVDVLCLRGVGEPARETLDGIRILRLPVRRSRGQGSLSQLFEYLVFFLLAAFRLSIMQRTRRYRTIQVHNLPDFLIFAAAIPKVMGARLILDLHDLMPELYAARRGCGMRSLEIRLLLLQEHLACRFADHVITVTDRWRETLISRSAPEEKVSVVMNLADPNQFRPTHEGPPSPEPGFHVLYHGTFTHRYGVDLLIKAVARAAGDIPGLRVRMLGDGETRADLITMTRELGLESIVEFSDGMVDTEKLCRAINWADVGVVPNRHNVFTDGIVPTKLLELVAMQTPVIATRSSAVMDYFSENMVYYVEPDDVDLLAVALCELAADPDKRANLAENAADFTEKYSWTAAAVDYVATVGRVGAKGFAPGLATGGYEWVLDTSMENAEWDAFVAEVPGGDLVQTSLWAQIKAELGWHAVRVIASRAGVIVGGGQLLTRPLSRLGAVGYVPRGPVGAGDADLEQLVLERLIAAARRMRVRHLTVQPMLGSLLARDTLAALGFDPRGEAVTPLATSCVDLSPEPDEILAGMSRRTRYNVRLSGRRGVEIDVGDAADIDEFHNLVEQTAARRNFTPFPRSYYHNMWRVLAPHDHIGLSFAVVDGRRVAAQLVTAFGDTVVNRLSVWSGSDGDTKPNEAIQWAAMQRSKSKGYASYDLEGISYDAARAVQDGEKLPEKYSGSTTSFKLGFGGDARTFPQPHTHIPGRIAPVVYRAAIGSTRGRKAMKQLRKAVRAGSRLRGSRGGR